MKWGLILVVMLPLVPADRFDPTYQSYKVIIMSKKKGKKRPSGRAWAQERAKRKGGSNIRGSREPWERLSIKGHYRRLKGGKKVWVKAHKRRKGKRKR